MKLRKEEYSESECMEIKEYEIISTKSKRNDKERWKWGEKNHDTEEEWAWSIFTGITHAWWERTPPPTHTHKQATHERTQYPQAYTHIYQQVAK